MELTEEQRTEIEKIASEVNCRKNFQCYKSESAKVCKARDIGLEQYVECLEDDPQNCEYSLSFGVGYFCRCPLQLYIVKRLKPVIL